MSSVEIIVGHQWQDDARFIDSLQPVRPAESALNVLELRDIIDIVIDGTNLTAPIPEEAIFGLVGNLLSALVDLVEGRATKSIIEFHQEPWELSIVADGPTLLLSVYSIDRRRRVVARDLSIDARDFVDALCAVGEQMLTDLFQVCEHLCVDHSVRAISQSLATLTRARRLSLPPRNVASANPQPRVGATSSAGGLTLRYSFDAADAGLTNYQGTHVFDLHALLTRGQLEAEFNNQEVLLCDGYPVLALASLLDRSRQLFNVFESRREAAFELDNELAHLPLTVIGEGDRWILRARDVQSGDDHDWAGSPTDCLDAMVSVAELFIQDLSRSNSHLKVNQRFVDLEEEVSKLRKWYNDLCGSNVYLDRPEDYLRRLGHVEPELTGEPKRASFPWPLRSVHTLFPNRRWSLQLEGLDFRSITLTDRSLVMISAGGVSSVDPQTGEELWRRGLKDKNGPKRSIVVSGDRIIAGGGGKILEILDLDSGEVLNQVEAGTSLDKIRGAAFYEDHQFGVIAASKGNLIGFDDAGQVVWRHSMAPGSIRSILFDGPLVCAQSSDGTMAALNPRSGDVLWKIRHGGTPELGAQVHQGRLYSMTQDPLHRGSTLYALYPFTGRTVWQLRLPGSTLGPPSFVDRWMIVALERHGQTVLAGIDLEAVDPHINWRLDLSSAGINAPTQILPVTIDGEPHGLVRTDRAELTCFSVVDGAIRWRSMPAAETLLLYGNLPLFQIGEALLNMTNSVDLRDLETGELLHSFQTIESPEFGLLVAPFCLIFGERGTRGDRTDRLTAWSVEHFLALVQ